MASPAAEAAAGVPHATSSGIDIDLETIRRAHERIAPYIFRTPVLSNAALNEAVGAELFFKCENLQKVAAFKARGACNAVLSLSSAEAARGVVTHSSGNHGAALAWGGKSARDSGMDRHAVERRAREAVRSRRVWRNDTILRAHRRRARSRLRGGGGRNRRDADPPLQRLARHRGAGHRRARTAPG